jgi:hypothetical protein
MMAGGKKRNRNKSIFGSIRKPTAPPSRKMGEEKPEQRVHPAERKLKHKKRIETDES